MNSFIVAALNQYYSNTTFHFTHHSELPHCFEWLRRHNCNTTDSADTSQHLFTHCLIQPLSRNFEWIMQGIHVLGVTQSPVCGTDGQVWSVFTGIWIMWQGVIWMLLCHWITVTRLPRAAPERERGGRSQLGTQWDDGLTGKIGMLLLSKV